MARTNQSRKEEDFYREVDVSRLDSGWSCATIIAILSVMYLTGAYLLWYWLR